MRRLDVKCPKCGGEIWLTITNNTTHIVEVDCRDCQCEHDDIRVYFDEGVLLVGFVTTVAPFHQREV